MRVWAHNFASLGILLSLGVGCDSTPRGRDAAAQSGQRMAEVAVHLDAANGGMPALSVLAFRASVTGVNPDDVLPAVDPLVVLPPEAGACVLRDVAGAARALGAQGGRVELDALSGLVLDLDPLRRTASGSIVRPTAHVFPNLASVVGGVVAEAGPLELSATPEVLGLGDSGGALFRVPAFPRMEQLDGGPLPPSPRFSATADLVLSVSRPSRITFVELRPYGATWALACPLVTQPGAGSGDRALLVVPAADLAKLAELRVPVFIEAVAREIQFAQLGASVGGAAVRLTLEVRSSSRVELVP
jgi:hypothetical protein